MICELLFGKTVRNAIRGWRCPTCNMPVWKEDCPNCHEILDWSVLNKEG